MFKLLFYSEIHRPGAPHSTETLAIGSGPLPARAPPEKKHAQNKSKSTTPHPVLAPAVQEMMQTASVVHSPPAVGPPMSSKSGTASSSMPKLSQPIPLSSRATLQPVGRGVAAAFSDQDVTWNESSDRSGNKGANTSSNLKPPSPDIEPVDKLNLAPPSERSVSGRERSAVYSKTSSIPVDKELQNEVGSFPPKDIPGVRLNASANMGPGDRSLSGSNKTDRTEDKTGRGEYEIGARRLGPGQNPAPSAKSYPNRGNPPKDQRGKKMEPVRCM